MEQAKNALMVGFSFHWRMVVCCCNEQTDGRLVVMVIKEMRASR